MRDFAIVFLHLIVTLARLAGPGGLRSVVAESVLVRVAVGISVARYPPHRSPRAALPHEALILDEWRQSELGGKGAGRAELGSIAPPADAFAPSLNNPSGRDESEPAATAGSPDSGIRVGCQCYRVPRDCLSRKLDLNAFSGKNRPR